MAKLLKQLVAQVGAEFGLEHGPRDKWLNDSVSFIGLQSKSNTVVFCHSNLVLKAADCHEMLAHKLTAFRGAKDVSDAIHFLKEIDPKDKQAIFKKVNEFRPFVPQVAERMVDVWNAPPKSSDERVPEWCENVPAVHERFSVIKPEEQSFWSGEPANDFFAKRNIFAPKEFMFFL